MHSWAFLAHNQCKGFCVQVLTSAGEDTVYGPVTDGSVAGLNVHKRFAAHPHEDPLLHAKLWNTTSAQCSFQRHAGRTVNKGQKGRVAAADTSAVSRLIPKDPLQVGGPGFLRLHAGGLQGVGVAALSPAEPDFKAQAAHAGVVRHADVAGLEQEKKMRGRSVIRCEENPERTSLRQQRPPPNLEGLLVDVDVVAHVVLLGFAEEDELFKEEDAPHAFLLAKENGKLVLANQLALLLQVHLVVEKSRQAPSPPHFYKQRKVQTFAASHHSP